MARTIKRSIIVILCNTGDYKLLDKKQQTASIPERLVALESILTSALKTQTDQLLTIKRVFGDHYA